MYKKHDKYYLYTWLSLLCLQSPSFWILARAVKEFVANEGQGSLPVRGTIPDMIADSSKFIKLQNVWVYKFFFSSY